MNNRFFVALSGVALLALTSCSGKLGELSADNFTVTPNPLETVGTKVPVTINGTFPEKYLKKNAVVTVTPELRFGNQVAPGTSATFQGEKVMGNDQTISYKVGGNYTMRSQWDYIDAMQSSELYLTFKAKVGNKEVEIPAVKVANGIIATSTLYNECLDTQSGSIAPDAYQRITQAKQTANIKFLIQQAELRKSELKNNSVTEFVNLLQRINNERETFNLTSIDVDAYASPDGGQELNDKLAAKRKQNTDKYLADQLKKIDMSANVDSRYTAQDWEGFQELVAASDIQDKDVILRVLSMYKDPEEREAQIKNISAAFRELADGILPELRRSRMTINYEVIGRSDQQIMDQYKSDASQLSVEELLYAATLTNNVNEANAIYKKAAELYPNEARAYNNAAVTEIANGNAAAAEALLKRALSVDTKSNEANANLGLLALAAGDNAKAQDYLAKAPNAAGVNEIVGTLNIAQGNAAQAERQLAGAATNAAALAQILNKNYAAAATTLNNIKNADGTTYYLQAILNARQDNNTAAAAALKKAIALDPALAQKAANDLELVNVAK